MSFTKPLPGTQCIYPATFVEYKDAACLTSTPTTFAQIQQGFGSNFLSQGCLPFEMVNPKSGEKMKVYWWTRCRDDEITISLHADAKCATPSMLQAVGFSDKELEFEPEKGGQVKCAQVAKDTWVSFKATGWKNSKAEKPTTAPATPVAPVYNNSSMYNNTSMYNNSSWDYYNNTSMYNNTSYNYYNNSSYNYYNNSSWNDTGYNYHNNSSMHNKTSGKDGQTYSIGGDGYNVKIKQGKANGGDKLTSEMKFDNYFMYGVDEMGTKGNSAPSCQPGKMD